MIAAAPACPHCHEQSRLWLQVPGDFARPHDRTVFRLWWCDGCDYGFLFPRPSPELVASWYDLPSYYTHRTDACDHASRRRSFLQRVCEHIAWRADEGQWTNDALRLRAADHEPMDICDIGCGNGQTLATLQQMGHRVVGIEVDPAACDVARRQGIEVHTGTAENLPPAVAHRRFDIVYMSHVLEHTLDPLTALASARHLLKPGGLFMCEVPNNACLSMQAAGIAWPFLDVPRHINFFTPRSLEELTRRAGLQVEAVEYAGFHRVLCTDWREAEQQRWDFFAPQLPPGESLPARSSQAGAWMLLMSTLLASPEKKYDSVRVVARQPESVEITPVVRAASAVRQAVI